MTRVTTGQRCVACGWPKATGIISFGHRLHEPHCEDCCKDWERVMRAAPPGWAGAVALTFESFRAWQATRKGKMAA